MLATVSGRTDEVVFGTVLFGRMNAGAGADRVFGPFINTLPIRVRLGGRGVGEALADVPASLAELLAHEHAPLALAQRASAVPGRTPLFSSLLNYRYDRISTPDYRHGLPGVRVLIYRERTDYPLAVSVDDLGEGFAITVDAPTPAEPEGVPPAARAIARPSRRGTGQDAGTASTTSNARFSQLDQLLRGWNDTPAADPRAELYDYFAESAAATPDVVAVEYEGLELTYAEVDAAPTS